MIIIVEGIDRVGKTTLCNKLSQELNIPIYKHKNEDFAYSNMDNVNETDKMLQLLDLYHLLNGNIIFDRFHWSDFAYGIIDRQYNIPLALENFKRIDKRLYKEKACVIYVKPTDIAKSSTQHGKDLTLYQSQMEYCYARSLIPTYACTYLSIDDVIKEVVNEYRL